jgi:hypothetical protein
MIVTIAKPSTREPLTLELQNTSVKNLRQMILDSIVTDKKIILLFKGTVLENERNLEYYGIRGPDDLINLVIGSLFL